MKALALCSPLVAAGCSATPSAEPPVSFGAEVRAYAAGVIPALYGEAPLSADELVTFSAGANLTDRRDWGEHDDEEGDGYGLGVGYRYLYGEDPDRWFLGARLDVWSLSIDWEDDPDRDGSSDVLVLQPTVEGGYRFALGGGWRLNVFVAVGAEINVDTDGEDVGEGGIALLGVSLVHGS